MDFQFQVYFKCFKLRCVWSYQLQALEGATTEKFQYSGSVVRVCIFTCLAKQDLETRMSISYALVLLPKSVKSSSRQNFKKVF